MRRKYHSIQNQGNSELKILEIVMTKSISLDTLWDSATPTELVFNLDKLAHLPAAAQRYLEHAIAPGTKLASAVRLKMHGEIKLTKWIPFTAEQVICWEHGLIWSAKAWMNGFLPIVGSDRVIDGIGAMQWKILGLFPVMTASGADITRSSIGRLESESLCLPSVFYRDDVSFTSTELSPLDSNLHSSFVVQGEKAELDFTIDPTGRLKTFTLPRWLGSLLFKLLIRAQPENDKNTRNIRSSAGIAVFVSDVNDKAHWVEVGRCYERFALQATALGICNALLN
jgi:hypothetical protein